MSNRGRVILITGTSRGIGLGLARHYLENGDTVCGCSRAKAALDHANYSHFELSVSDERQVVEMVRACVRTHGRIDGLLNNAGIASMNHALLSPAGTAREVFDTNFHGTFLFCREVAKAMVRAKSGRIVNFTTVATPLKLEGESLYAASKAAVESFTRVLARELGETGVTVNAVGPTPIQTDLIKNVPEAKMKALLSRQAITRFGTVEDVANVVDFFLSERSAFVTGQVVYLGGVSG
jgi:3-oxoacyl-[acyl-carrier protein] reductase